MELKEFSLAATCFYGGMGVQFTVENWTLLFSASLFFPFPVPGNAGESRHFMEPAGRERGAERLSKYPSTNGMHRRPCVDRPFRLSSCGFRKRSKMVTQLLHAQHEHNGWLETHLEELLTGFGLREDLTELLIHFLFDLVSLFVIFMVIYLVVSFLQTFVGVQRQIQKLSRLPLAVGYPAAALLGALLPMCSCTIVPVFMALVWAGVPLGLCFTLLASTSLINFTTLVAVVSLLGAPFGAAYLLSGLAVSLITGVVIGKLNWTGSVNLSSAEGRDSCGCGCHHGESSGDGCSCGHADPAHRHDHPSLYQGGALAFSQRLSAAWVNTCHILGRTWLFLILGVLLSSILNQYVNQLQLEQFLSANAWLLLPASGLMGAVLHSESISVIPLMESLLYNGLPLGVGITFFLTTTGISVPVYLMLVKTIRPKLLNLYFALVTVCSVLCGAALLLFSRF